MTTTALIATDSLSAYIQKAQQQPILSEETERALATRYQTEGDLEAAKTIMKLMDVLNEDEDVVRVTTNAELDDSLLAQLG